MIEFEIDWIFYFTTLFMIFITAGLVTGKNEYDKKLEKEKQKTNSMEKDKYHELEERVNLLEEKIL